MYSCIHVLMYSCIHVFMYSCFHVFMYLCTHVLTYSCTHALMHSCIHVFMYLIVLCTHVCRDPWPMMHQTQACAEGVRAGLSRVHSPCMRDRWDVRREGKGREGRRCAGDVSMVVDGCLPTTIIATLGHAINGGPRVIPHATFEKQQAWMKGGLAWK